MNRATKRKLAGLLVIFAVLGIIGAAWQTQQNFGTGLPVGLFFTPPTFTISTSGSGNGVLALAGNTSGTATLTAPSTAGTPTNPVLGSNSLQLATGDVYSINGDTGLSRGSANVWDIGSGAAASTAGFIKSAQTLQVITNNFTTTSTTLAAAGVITGLNFTAPANAATNWSFHCDLIYSQATAAAADLFGITTAGTAPTNLQVASEVYTSNAGAQTDNNALITTATSTTVVTATPSAFGAISTNADMFIFRIWGTLEAPSNASPTQVGIAVATGAGADALTIYRGSACWWY